MDREIIIVLKQHKLQLRLMTITFIFFVQNKGTDQFIDSTKPRVRLFFEFSCFQSRCHMCMKLNTEPRRLLLQTFLL